MCVYVHTCADPHDSRVRCLADLSGRRVVYEIRQPGFKSCLHYLHLFDLGDITEYPVPQFFPIGRDNDSAYFKALAWLLGDS